MSEETMPAAEAAERNNYELAFHVLPTVAEGEVSGVFDSIKSLITTNGGELVDEETPARFELAYEIIKHIDGKNRKFASAYFGWVRFSSEAASIETIAEGMDENTNILRHMVLKLTKAEEADAFRFHEALDVPMVEDIEDVKESTKVSDSEESETKEDQEVEEVEKTEEATTEEDKA
jgi:ribosomal protein S6